MILFYDFVLDSSHSLENVVSYYQSDIARSILADGCLPMGMKIGKVEK